VLLSATGLANVSLQNTPSEVPAEAPRAPNNRLDLGTMMQIHHTPNNTNHIVNFSSQHPGGINFLSGDGSVHFLADTIDFDTFRWLGERADGQLTSGILR